MTTATAYGKISKVPEAEFTIVEAPPITFITESTPQSVDFAVHGDVYTDAQFYADLEKASKQLNAMLKEALEEHAQGKTRKFPA